MKKMIGMMASLAAMVAGGVRKEAADIYDLRLILRSPNVTLTINPEDFGIYRAGAKAHKQFLRKNHLGKFRKGR